MEKLTRKHFIHRFIPIFGALVLTILLVTGCELTIRSEWPGIVMLYRGRSFICGGVLVAPDIVLTAKHCSEAGPDRIAVGRSNRMATDGTELMIVGSCRSDPDPDGVCAKLRSETDLELHQLEHPVPTIVSQVARLATEAEYNPDNPFYALGWAGGDGSLRVVRVEYYLRPPLLCTDYTPPPGSWICAAGPILRPTDSGGPLYVEVGAERALIGIASSSSRRGPGVTGPAIVDFWQRVPSYLSEIPGVVGPIGPESWELSTCEVPIRSASAWCGPSKYSLRGADFNGDSYNDLIGVGPSGRMWTWLRRPTGGFSETTQGYLDTQSRYLDFRLPALFAHPWLHFRTHMSLVPLCVSLKGSERLLGEAYSEFEFLLCFDVDVDRGVMSRFLSNIRYLQSNFGHLIQLAV